MHSIVEDRLMASALRRWRFFHLPLRPQLEAIHDAPVAKTTDACDKRYQSELAPIRQFLDVGCKALTLSRLAECPLHTHRYLGITHDEDVLKEVRTRFPEYTFCLSPTPEGWGQFDRVVDASFQRLDFAALHRILRPLGWLGIIMQTQKHPAIVQRHFITATGLRAELKEAGFSRIDIHGISPPEFYDVPARLSVLELRAIARNSFRFTPPDDCSYLIARARKL